MDYLKTLIESDDLQDFGQDIVKNIKFEHRDKSSILRYFGGMQGHLKERDINTRARIRTRTNIYNGTIVDIFIEHVRKEIMKNQSNNIKFLLRRINEVHAKYLEVVESFQFGKLSEHLGPYTEDDEEVEALESFDNRYFAGIDVLLFPGLDEHDVRLPDIYTKSTFIVTAGKVKINKITTLINFDYLETYRFDNDLDIIQTD